MLKSAMEEAKLIKEERAAASERKLRAPPPTRMQRIDPDERYDVHVCTPLDKYNQFY